MTASVRTLEPGAGTAGEAVIGIAVVVVGVGVAVGAGVIAIGVVVVGVAERRGRNCAGGSNRRPGDAGGRPDGTTGSISCGADRPAVMIAAMRVAVASRHGGGSHGSGDQCSGRDDCQAFHGGLLA